MNADPLRMENVCRDFGGLEVLRDLTVAIAPNEFVAVVGPSGCGKTTLLNILSGYDKPSSGSIERHGRVRMVYQQDGLFPWKTVSGNIALGFRDADGKVDPQAQILDLVRLMRLDGFENHYPHQLSGGMRQRVELARALAGSSDVLLMDEPFSALDYLTRLTMRAELARILNERRRTVVLVTHDIEEAAQLADRVLVLSERPAQIRYQLNLSAPRPRDPTQPDVVQAVDRILSMLDMQRKTGSFAAQHID